MTRAAIHGQTIFAPPAPHPAWRPLLGGALAERARAAAQAIASALRPMPFDQQTPAGLYADVALLFAYLAQADRRPGDSAGTEAWLDRAVDAVAAQRLQPALYGGFSGIGWAVTHIRGLSGGAPDDQCEPIDQALLNLVERSPWRRDYDLILGLVGFGVYALERLPRPAAAACLEQIVARLAETAERRSGRATWWTDPRLLPPDNRAESPHGYYNLGLAHGVPGVIALLGGACAAGVAASTARPLLDEAVAWLLAQRLPAGAGSSFDYWVAPGVAQRGSRLAWCYGDLGVAAALLLAARAVGQPRWERAARAIADNAAARPPEQAGVIDAGLCHGSAGVAHLFNRLYQATGAENLAEAARRWFARTLELQRPGHGIAGFSAWAPSRGADSAWVPDPSFLCGAAGIGLALLGATSSVEPNWDRTLMVAIPPRAR